MEKKKDYEILMTGEGHFFFGRMLKNGTMSADSARIEDDQVMKMFAAYFERYCAQSKTDTMWIRNPHGAILVKQVAAEKIQEALSVKPAKPSAKRQPARKKGKKEMGKGS